MGRTGKRLRVLCILPRMNDSRIARRIDMLSEAGFAVEAVAFERAQDTGRDPDCPVESLGSMRHGHYLSRLPRLMRAVPLVRCAVRRADLVYAFSPDLALLALASGTGLDRPVALETADIREVQVAGDWKGWTVRAMEKFVTRRICLLVLTSEGYRAYYRDWLHRDLQDIVIENKVDASLAESVRASRADTKQLGDRVRIGWFGMLRDEWTWRVLARLLNSEPQQFSAILAGEGMLDGFEVRVKGCPNTRYLGEYAHPTGLAGLYGIVDLVMACYPPHVPHGWSRSNRYYEACLFGKPLIVRSGCADAERVGDLDIGLVIDGTDPDGAAAAIGAITPDDLARWRSNLAALPEREYALTGETSLLADALATAGGTDG